MGRFSIRPHYELLPPYNTYFGGKSGEGVYQTIIGQMPPHHVYCEPFAGSAAIFRRKALAQVSYLGDMDAPLMLAHARTQASVSHDPVGMLQAINETLALADDSSPYTRFAHFAVMANSSPTITNTGRSASVAFLADNWHFTVEQAIQKVRQVEAARKTLNLLTYFDPPYLLDTRSSDTRYKYELRTADHLKFLQYIKTMPGMVMVSSYPNELYRRELAGWRLVVFQAKTRGGVATEWLFCNFPEPTHLHDYRYLGDDYRVRENVKNREKNLLTEFARLPTLQRHALLASLTMAVPEMEPVPMPGGKRIGTDLAPTPALVEASSLVDLLPADDLVLAMAAGMDLSASVADSVPDQQPVAAGIKSLLPTRSAPYERSIDPALVDRPFYYPLKADQVFVQHRCQVCGKCKDNSRNWQPDKVASWGWQMVAPDFWIDNAWLCSIGCMEKAAAVPAADSVAPGNESTPCH